MALDHEIAAMAAKAGDKPTLVEQFARQMRSRRERVAHYRKVFLDDAGQLTESGRYVVADLARIAQFGRANPAAPADDLRAREAQRVLVLHIFASFDLDEAKFVRLSRQLRESEHE